MVDGLVGTTCAFVGCGDPAACCLVGGCVNVRFPKPAPVAADDLPRAKAFNGTKPARTIRDPRVIRRRRKVKLK